MAIVERPLAAVIAQPQIQNPRQLEGRLTGVTGLPSDTAVLDSVVAGAGGDPHRLHTITIGFNAVPALLAGRVAAATAFWNDEGVTLQRARPGFHIFKVDDFGAPAYPELVLCATESTVVHRLMLAFDVVHTLLRGYHFTVAHPAAAAAELEAQVPGLNPALVSAQLARLEPAFRAPDGQVGGSRHAGADSVGAVGGEVRHRQTAARRRAHVQPTPARRLSLRAAPRARRPPAPSATAEPPGRTPPRSACALTSASTCE